MPAVTNEFLIVYGSVKVDSVAAAVGGNTAYTLEGDQPTAWITAGLQVNIYNSTNAVNNGTFVVVSLVGDVLTVVNAAGVIELSPSPGLVGFPVGGTSEFELHSIHVKDKDYQVTSLSFETVYSGLADDATAKSFSNSLEEAFRSPFQRLRFLQGTEVIDDFNPEAEASGNTGFLQQPRVSKPGDPKRDSGKSRRYQITVNLELPADKPGRAGRRTADVSIEFDAARRQTITVSSQWTALGSSDASAVYNAAKTAYYNSVLTLFSSGAADFEITFESFKPDDENKILDARAVFHQILFNQSAGTLDNAAIVESNYDFQRQQMAPGDSSPTAKRLEVITAVFDCSVDETETRDLNDLWENTIRPHLIAEARTRFDLSGPIAITNVQPNLAKSGNRIRGSVQLLAVAGSSLVEFTVTVEVTDRKGKRLVPTWDGNPRSKHVYQGNADLIRITTEVELTTIGAAGGTGPGGGGFGGPNPQANPANAGGGGGGGVGGGVGSPPPTGGNAPDISGNSVLPGGSLDPLTQTPNEITATGWHVISDQQSTRPIFIGLPEEGQIELTETTRIIAEEYAEKPKAAGGGGPQPVSSVSAATGSDVAGNPPGIGGG